jgi:putative oxygen-independent coproporphyrinogen III oxidase
VNSIPLSLYVHLPWCVRKCPYCDFNSYTSGDAAPRTRYLDALIKDIESEAARADGRTLVSIFLGGGTPSLFTPGEISRLIDAAAEHFALASDIEITMEANPGTVECGDPTGYRNAGVNRLSIGAQSFSQESLHLLGRIHSVDDISRSMDEASSAGFDSINLDLMYGLPKQGVDQALADIESALALQPQHLSWYQLTLEPNTVFHARPPDGLPDEELLWDIQENGQRLLAGSGFDQYEVSAWSRQGHRCRHNLNYWSFGDYLAVGAGAHGKLSDASGIHRYAKAMNPISYMQAIENQPVEELPDALGETELVFEFMLNALRLSGGFEEALFEERTGLPAGTLCDAAREAKKKGLIDSPESGFWRPTALGRRFLNDLQAEFLPESTQ